MILQPAQWSVISFLWNSIFLEINSSRKAEIYSKAELVCDQQDTVVMAGLSALLQS